MPSAAKRCFDENIRLFSDPNAEPEKFNLYNGLADLATSIERIEQELRQIQNELLQQRR